MLPNLYMDPPMDPFDGRRPPHMRTLLINHMLERGPKPQMDQVGDQPIKGTPHPRRSPQRTELVLARQERGEIVRETLIKVMDKRPPWAIGRGSPLLLAHLELPSAAIA